MTRNTLRAGVDTPAVPPRTGQVALVTGGPSGLGLTIATAMAHEGSHIVLAGRSIARCQRVAARLSADIASFTATPATSPTSAPSQTWSNAC